MFPLTLLLASCLGPDPDDALVARLAADDWAERAAAEKALRSRGWAARKALARGKADPDPGVRHATGVLYAEALGKTIASLEPVPEIDAAWWSMTEGWYRRDLYGGCPYNRLVPYLDRVGRDNYPYANYYTATRLWLADELEAGVPPWVLRAVLWEMRRRDARFLARIAGDKPVP